MKTQLHGITHNDQWRFKLYFDEDMEDMEGFISYGVVAEVRCDCGQCWKEYESIWGNQYDDSLSYKEVLKDIASANWPVFI